MREGGKRKDAGERNILLRLPSMLLRRDDDVSNQRTNRVVERSETRGAIAAEASMLMVGSRDSYRRQKKQRNANDHVPA
jgi:hypothetical protein